MAAKKKPKRRKCHGRTVKDKPCGAIPLKPGTVIEGVKVKGKHCRRHDPDIPESARFGTVEQAKAAAQLGGRPRRIRPSEISQRLMEENQLTVERPYWRALGYDVKIGKNGPELVELPGGGAKVVAKFQGSTYESNIDDLGAQMEAAEKLKDRSFGKPAQALELTGKDGNPIEVDPLAFADPKVRKAADEYARRVGNARADGARRSRSGD